MAKSIEDNFSLQTSFKSFQKFFFWIQILKASILFQERKLSTCFPVNLLPFHFKATEI